MIRLYDTLTRQKRDFKPQDAKRITMYVCGPTVYGRAHIGNARPAVVFDTLARLIRHEFGAESLVYARNVTDVDDKIIAAAEAEGVEPSVVTERYERHYLEDMGALGVEPPSIAPHATREIGPMIALIERLVGLGHAYEADGHVLFSVPSDPDYGVLSRRDRDSMIAGARVEVAPYKRDPADFVLWKPSGEGVIGWDSPWGRGRPGWHIECSAMIHNHLGETIDVHGGGLDLIFPHHENEIAQSRCAQAGAPLARYWVHNGFVDMGAEKMSKSLGNVITVGDLLDYGHRAVTLRLALLSSHYRQPLPWTEERIAFAKGLADRYFRAIEIYDGRKADAPGDILEALFDDLNTALALNRLEHHIADVFRFRDAMYDLVEDNELLNQGQDLEWARRAASSVVAAGKLLGLPDSADEWFGRSEDDRVKAAIDARASAKIQKDFATADRIREELKAEGIVLEDGPDGTTWRRA